MSWRTTWANSECKATLNHKIRTYLRKKKSLEGDYYFYDTQLHLISLGAYPVQYCLPYITVRVLLHFDCNQYRPTFSPSEVIWVLHTAPIYLKQLPFPCPDRQIQEYSVHGIIYDIHFLVLYQSESVKPGNMSQFICLTASVTSVFFPLVIVGGRKKMVKAKDGLYSGK